VKAPQPRRSPPNIIIGLVRLAFFDRRGLALFGDSSQDFLSSLAPLIAFPLVGGVLTLFRGAGVSAVTNLLATLCVLLAPAVLSEALAGLWRKREGWLRYATAFNWCQWTIPMAAAVALLAMAVLAMAGLPETAAAYGAAGLLAAYGLSLHWFLARIGLDLSRLRAVLLVVVVNLGTAILLFGPQLMMDWLHGVPLRLG
jgi:hypothetical protein